MANEKLSRLIEKKREDLTQNWMRMVRSDSRIDSDDLLTRSELRDHVPAILEEICDLLLADETPTPTNTLEGRVKVFLRIQQGYRGLDLAREVCLLRTSVLDFLAEQCSTPDFNADLKTYHSSARIIDRYFDEVLCNAISVYSETADRPPSNDLLDS